MMINDKNVHALLSLSAPPTQNDWPTTLNVLFVVVLTKLFHVEHENLNDVFPDGIVKLAEPLNPNPVFLSTKTHVEFVRPLVVQSSQFVCSPPVGRVAVAFQ